MLRSNKSCIAYIGRETKMHHCNVNPILRSILKIINHKSAEMPLLNTSSLNFGNVEIKFKESQYKSN